jgi:hypothetical protein
MLYTSDISIIEAGTSAAHFCVRVIEHQIIVNAANHLANYLARASRLKEGRAAVAATQLAYSALL